MMMVMNAGGAGAGRPQELVAEASRVEAGRRKSARRAPSALPEPHTERWGEAQETILEQKPELVPVGRPV